MTKKISIDSRTLKEKSFEIESIQALLSYYINYVVFDRIEL